jgi:hypothetical protein
MENIGYILLPHNIQWISENFKDEQQKTYQFIRIRTG